MSYNILNKNVKFAGSTQGTIENVVDTHSSQSISGSKDFLNLTGSAIKVTNDLTVAGNITASVNISASAFYGDGSNLSNIDQVVTAYSNGGSAANSRILTSAGSTSIDAESNLTFNATTKELVLGGLILPGTASFFGNVSASINMSASGFYGSGIGITGIPGSAVSLASGGGITDSSGLKLDSSVDAVDSLATADKILIFDAGSGDAIKRTTAGAIANLFDAAVETFTNQTQHRVVTVEGANAIDGEANLTFDGSELVVVGNISGSSMISGSNAHIVSQMHAGSIELGSAAGIAGDGLVNNSGALDVQVSGALKLASDKIGITGSIAGDGLTYEGGDNSISAIKLALDELADTTMTVADDYIIFLDGGASGAAKKEKFEDVIGNVAHTGLNHSNGRLTVDVSDFMSNGSSDRIVTATGADAMNAEANFTFNGETNLLTVTGDVTASVNISASAFYGDGSNLSGVAIDIDSLSAGTSISQGDYFIYADDGVEKKITLSDVEDEIFGNVSGDASIAAGGALTIAANAVEGSMLNSNVAGSGLDYTSNELRVDVSDFMTNGANNYVVTATGTDAMNAEANLSFDGSKLSATGQISASLGVSGSSLETQTTFINATHFSSSLNVSASAFYGDGSTLSGITATLDIDGYSALGGTGLHQTQDHFVFSDNGTEKKITFSNLEDAIFSNISGDAAVAAGGALTIQANAIEGSMLNSNVAGTGLDYGSNELSVDVSDFMTNGANNYVITATGTDAMNAEANLTFDGSKLAATGQISASLGVSGSSLETQTTFINSTHLSSSLNVSASAFYGDGSNLSGVSVDIDNLSALGGTGLHQTQDHFIFSDNGTEKKITFSNLEDAIFANVSGDAAIAAGGALTIQANAIEGSMLNSNVAGTGLDYTSNELRVDVSDFMANGSDNRIVTATGADAMNAEANLSFDGSKLSATGHISASLGVSGSSLETQTTFINSTHFSSSLNVSASAFYGDGSNLSGVGGSLDIDGYDALGGTGLHQTQDHFVFSDNGTEKKITFSNLEDAIFANVSGDAAIAAGGALTIAANAVEGSMLNSNVAGTGLDYGSNELSVDVSDFMTNGSDNRIVTATGTDAMNAEANLTFDGSTMVVNGAVSGSGNISGSAFYTSNATNNPTIMHNTVGTSGSVMQMLYKEELMTCGTDNNFDEIPNFLEQGMVPIALGIRIAQGMGNNAYISKIGTINDDDAFGVFNNGTIETGGDSLVTAYSPGAGTGQSAYWYSQNTELRVTYNATPASGSIRFGLYYYKITPPTA